MGIYAFLLSDFKDQYEAFLPENAAQKTSTETVFEDLGREVSAHFKILKIELG